MTCYAGSNSDMIAPKFRTQFYPGITNEQALEWWDSMLNGLGKDADMGVSVQDGRNMYFCDDDAEMVPAVKESERLDDPNVIRRLMQQSQTIGGPSL